MKLLPYTAIDGIPTFQDSFIRGLYERMDKEGLLRWVFYDGCIKAADEFLKVMKFGMNRLFVIEFKGEIAGLCWLNNFTTRTGEFHFCFFENLRGPDAVEQGRKVVCELLYMTDVHGNPMFDLLFGLTEVGNRPAVSWCKRMKFEPLGILPAALWIAEEQKSVPAWYHYVERGMYGQEGR